MDEQIEPMVFVGRSINVFDIPRPFQAVLVSKELCDAVGLVLISWGNLEHQIEMLVTALMEADQPAVRQVKVPWQFGLKLERVTHLVARHFAAHPALVELWKDLMAHAEKLQIVRNALTHGNSVLQVTATSEGSVEELVVRTRKKRKEEEWTFSTSKLTNLYHGIGQLTAIISIACDPSQVDKLEKLSPEDRGRLADFMRRHHPSHAAAQQGGASP